MAKNQKDYYYYKAKQFGYRSRASYKLKQIQEKEHIIKKKIMLLILELLLVDGFKLQENYLLVK